MTATRRFSKSTRTPGLVEYLLTPALLLLIMSLGLPCLASGTTGLEEADQRFQDQEWEEAAALYETHLIDEVEDSQAWYQYGYSLHRLDRDSLALEAFSRAEELGATNPRLFGLSAISAARLGQDDRAVGLLERAVQTGMPFTVIQSTAAFDPLRDRADFKEVVATAEASTFPCRSHAESRQFDFWVGKWRVEAAGQQVGTNVIDGQLEGCLVFEHYTTPGGYEGVSLNYYDPLIEGWRQIWIDNTGLATLYEGHFVDGKMTFLGESSRKDGSKQKMRMTFSENPDGSVRQLIEAITGEDGEWSTSFDGRYVLEE